VSTGVHVLSQILACCESAILKEATGKCALELSQVVPIVLVEVALAIENLMTSLTAKFPYRQRSNTGLIAIL